MEKMILSVQYGDLNAAPPRMKTIAERRAERANKGVTLKESTYIMNYSVSMHGGFFVENQVGEELDDNQIQVFATEGNQIVITAAVQSGKVGLMALRNEKKFPLVQINDVLSYAEPCEGRCELRVVSPGVEGFTVYVMSNA